MPTTTASSPSEIDVVLADLWTRTSKLARQISQMHESIARSGRLPYRVEQDREILARYEAERDALRAEARPFEVEYSRRPWARYFLVRNVGGHVHSSMECSTCYASTEFAWLPSLSAATEAEMVAEFGELACTVCFPSAPTHRGFGDGTSAIARYSAAEQAVRACERGAKRAAKAAKAITDVDGSPLRTQWGVLRTKVAARNELSNLAQNRVYYPNSRTAREDADFDRLVAALEAAGIETAPVIARATAKATKEMAR